MTLVYFAPVPWDSYLQRPHYVVQHFLRHRGDRAIWIDPHPVRFPRLRDSRRGAASKPLATTRPAGLTVVKPRAIPLEPLALGRWFNWMLTGNRLVRRLTRLKHDSRLAIGIGRPSQLALGALRTLDPSWSFYDAMDDFPEFYAGLAKRSIAGCEHEIAKLVDAILTPSSALWDKFARHQAKRLMLPNASEMSLLPASVKPPRGRPVLGYVGCIGSWFDWPLVFRLADASPDAHIHIVGPCFAQPPRPLPENLTLFPACTHEHAVNHLKHFSVGLIPFKRTPLTDAVDPIKYYEYRGMGLPVLTARFGEMTQRGTSDDTYFMDNGLRASVSAALSRRPDTASIAEFRRQNTWSRRFESARLFERMEVR